MIADTTLEGPIAVVGTGRLGRALASALEARGLRVVRVRGRAEPATAPGALRGVRTVLLAVPDGALAEVAARLAPEASASRPVALHHSGALDSSVLAPLREAGCAAGSCHPIQTFPGTGAPSPDAFAGVTFGVEGDPAAREAGAALARLLGGRAVEIDASKKPLYHLAAVLAGNGAVALVSAAAAAMRAAGLSEPEAREALAPLARRSLENAIAQGPEAALTGPVARGDEATLARHREALDAWDPERRALYDALVAEQRRIARKSPS